ncbi:MAG: SpoIIE family protein phosphatase [Phycisphaerales bacterium]|nr:MAG: SpoIIE family protein phosphatase [Phycisphaerales bacterium]
MESREALVDFDVSLALKDRALGAAAEGITISDPSLPDNPLIYVNSGFERLTGYSAASVLGKNCRFLQGPDTDPRAAEAIRKAVAEEGECTVEILNYREDGSPFWNRLSVTPVRDGHGAVTHFIGVQSDVSARRTAEDKLRLANAKMKSDLAAAAKVQQAMLPHTLPEAKGFQFAWRYRPCEELAGDTLNCFWLDETHIGVYIVDVSGHGVAASLLSVTLSRMLLPLPGPSLLYTASPTDPSERSLAAPSAVAERLNLQFPFDERTGQFFTMVYGVLDTQTARFEYVSAGHPPLIWLDTNGSVSELRRDQFPVGIVPETRFASDRIQLRPGQRLFLYTDGATDASNKTRQSYDSERLCETIAAGRDRTLDAVLGDIIASIERFCGDATIRDDISVLGLEATTV